MSEEADQAFEPALSALTAIMLVMARAPFDVDGTVTPERLGELLAVGHELDVLDYKRQLDLGKGPDHEKDRAEFAKDVVALSSLSTGGYIVIGADDHGRVASAAEPIKAEQFDEATLRQIAQSYVDGALHLAARTITVGDRTLALVFVGPSRDGLPLVMSREGSYLGDDGKRRAVFRRGDMFVREGTISRQIKHADWPAVLARYRSLVREEVHADLERMRPSSGAIAAPTLEVALPLDSFEAAVDAALVAGNHAAVRAVAAQIRRSRSVWSDPEGAKEGLAVLDRAATLGAVALRHRDAVAFELAVGALHELYIGALADRNSSTASDGLGVVAGRWWSAIAARALALLAAVVRERAWELVRTVVFRPVGPVGPIGYHSWFRHAIALSSEAHRVGGPLIYFARSALPRIPALHADLPVEEVEQDPIGSPNAGDRLVDSMCQADFLWCVLIEAEYGGSRSQHEIYPSFGVFFEPRVRDLAVALVTDDDLRRTLTSQSDGRFAAALLSVSDLAGRVATRPWSVIEGPVADFVSDNANWGG